MRILKVLLATSLIFSTPAFAADVEPATAPQAAPTAAMPPAPKAAVTPPANKSLSPLVQGVKVFNMIQSANRLFLAMKVGASSSDEQFLDALAEKYKGQPLPKASTKGNAIFLQGLEKPLKVEDLSKGLFSYAGKTFDVNMKDGVEKGLEDLEKVVFPKPVSAWNWIFPQAHANTDPMIVLASVVGVGGLALGANSCFDGPNNSAIGCGMGGLMGGFGLGYLIASYLNNDNPAPPQNMTCYPGQNGCRQVVLMGP
ncbi:MAG: hypothetical protein ACXVA9_02400, partial [Bdellovibrionales bacterium]